MMCLLEGMDSVDIDVFWSAPCGISNLIFYFAKCSGLTDVRGERVMASWYAILLVRFTAAKDSRMGW